MFETGFSGIYWGNVVMFLIASTFIYLGIAKDYEPLLLVPIGFGMLVGNIPLATGMNIGIYEDGSVLKVLYSGVTQGWYPSLIFLGGAAADDIGIQSGGWTIEWQGQSGDITPGTTILQGIQAAASADPTHHLSPVPSYSSSAP